MKARTCTPRRPSHHRRMVRGRARRPRRPRMGALCGVRSWCSRRTWPETAPRRRLRRRDGARLLSLSDTAIRISEAGRTECVGACAGCRMRRARTERSIERATLKRVSQTRQPRRRSETSRHVYVYVSRVVLAAKQSCVCVWTCKGSSSLARPALAHVEALLLDAQLARARAG